MQHEAMSRAASRARSKAAFLDDPFEDLLDHVGFSLRVASTIPACLTTGFPLDAAAGSDTFKGKA
jgi:hypothetical protein